MLLLLSEPQDSRCLWLGARGRLLAVRKTLG